MPVERGGAAPVRRSIYTYYSMLCNALKVEKRRKRRFFQGKFPPGDCCAAPGCQRKTAWLLVQSKPQDIVFCAARQI